MKDSLKPGLTFEFKFEVPDSKTVPSLYPEASEFQAMPKVFATGYLVGLFEWACIRAINAHIEWPEEQTVGISVNMSHLAATPPGLTVTVKGTLTQVKGRKLTFDLVADDGVEKISACTHERFVVNAKKFNAAVEKKRTDAPCGRT